MRITSESVELRDDQRSLTNPTFRQRSREFWAVSAFTAFHLDEFYNRLRTEACEVGCDGGALCLNPRRCWGLGGRGGASDVQVPLADRDCTGPDRLTSLDTRRRF